MSEIKQFARIRASQCWERRGKTIHIKDKAIGIAPDYNSTITRPLVNFVAFDDVLEEQSTNQDVFDKVLKPMCDRAVAEENASNSMFICHGHSASGKTHTILGSDDSKKGVVELSAEYLLEHVASHNVELQVIESYGKKKKKVGIFDVLRGRKIQSDSLSEGDISSFFMWSEKNSGIRRTVKSICTNLHFGCTARHNQSSRGHVAYILSIRKKHDRKEHGEKIRIVLLDLGAPMTSKPPFNKRFLSKCDPLVVKEWKHEATSLGRGLQGLQKQIRTIVTGEKVKEHTSDPLRTLLYQILVVGGKPLMMNILSTFSPSITCAKESRLTLRDVHSMTGCRVYPERCCWKKEHLEDPSLRFKNAAQNVQLKVKALKQMNSARGQLNLKMDHNDLEIMVQEVRQSMDAQQLRKLVVEDASTDISFQSEHLVNVTDYHGRRRTVEQKAVSLYYEELQFADEATKHTLGDVLLSNEERKSMEQTRQSIQMEMESLRSAARESNIPFIPLPLITFDEPGNQLNQPISGLLDMDENQEEGMVLDSEFTTQRAVSEISDEDIDTLGVDEQYLELEQQRLEKYEKTLKETLGALKDVSSYEECFPEEVKRIESELARIEEEQVALTLQAEAFEDHTNNIGMAVQQQMVSSEEDAVDDHLEQEDNQDMEMISPGAHPSRRREQNVITDGNTVCCTGNPGEENVQVFCEIM